jgi:hypothetical protein
VFLQEAMAPHLEGGAVRAALLLALLQAVHFGLSNAHVIDLEEMEASAAWRARAMAMGPQKEEWEGSSSSSLAHQPMLALADDKNGVGAAHHVLVWQVELADTQCTSPHQAPCFNVYALNASGGGGGDDGASSADVLWYAYSTDVTGIKAVSTSRRRSVFFSNCLFTLCL